MPDTLRGQIEAELDRREARAKAAIDAHGENWYVGLCYEDGYHVEGLARPDLLVAATAEETAEHIAMHDPADALRRYAAARRVLARHNPRPEPVETPMGPVTVCRTCSDLDQDTYRVVAWPCWEALDLADSLGLSTTSEEQHHG